MPSIHPQHRLQSEHTAPIAAAPYAIAETIRDPSTWDSWVDPGSRFELVQSHSLTDHVVYMRQKGVPWLRIKDRDVVLHSRIARDNAGALHMTGHAMEHSARPPLPCVVRMPEMHCRFDIVPSQSGSTVTYAVDLDMGGSIPLWLKRLVVANIAAKTLSDLSRYLGDHVPRDASALQAALEPRGSAAARLGAAVGHAAPCHA